MGGGRGRGDNARDNGWEGVTGLGDDNGDGDGDGDGCKGECDWVKRMSCSAYLCISSGDMTNLKSLRRRNWSSNWLSSAWGRPPTLAYREFV
jgi:hypothetical protein